MTSRPRVGVTLLRDRPWAQAEREWRLAEDLGFDHAWTYDHMTWAPLSGAPWFAAVPTLTAAALATSRIGLGTLVASPNNHHPAQFIREILALDDISRGRLRLAVGAGGDLDAELTAPGISRGERTARFKEFVEFLDQLMRQDPVSFHGAHYDSSDVGSLPGPLNTDDGARVPLIVAANGPRAVRLAVERGAGWLTSGGKADHAAGWWAQVRETAERVTAEVERQGRSSPLPRYLSLDSCPDYALASADAFEDALGRAGDLGFTDVISVWPRSSDPYAGDERVVRAVAARLFG